MSKSRLVRNLKPGDRLRVIGDNESRIVTVSRVQETRAGFLTKRRMWEAILSSPPFWFPNTITGYHDTRVEVLS